MNFLKKTLVIGSEAFLGKAFLKALPESEGTHYKSIDPKKRVDLQSPDITALNLCKGEYSHAIIVAANTNLALCEQEKTAEYRSNVEGTLDLVTALLKFDIQPVVFSTAYVFNGNTGDYNELSDTNPINEYGRQKELIEKKLPQICGDNYLIVRAGKIFDSNFSGTFLDQIHNDLINQRIVRAAHDHIFNPLLVEDLVDAVIALQKKGKKGLYNICHKEIWTRLDLAREIACRMNINPDYVKAISLDEIESPYRLPKKTNMSCAKLASEIDFRPTSIFDCIEKILKREK